MFGMDLVAYYLRKQQSNEADQSNSLHHILFACFILGTIASKIA
jgi:hypothetical protein